MRWKGLLIFAGVFLISLACAVSDTSVFQGQYYIGTEFQKGTYEFEFNIYTGEIFGDLVYTANETLTTGTWGQWRVELNGISAACNDTTKDYFMEITIDGNTQTPRRRLTHFNYLRKDVDESTTGDLTISSLLNFLLGGYLQEFPSYFLISKSLEISGDLNVTGNVISNNKLVCLEDGTNCLTQAFNDANCSVEGSCSNIVYDSELNYTLDTSASVNCVGDQVLLGNSSCISSSILGGSGGSSTQYVSFISTVDGTLGKNNMYLSLGTDGGISPSSSEMSWIIDRDMTITGILWDSFSNSRTKTSAITLMRGSNKNSLSDTSLSKNIQGIVKGYDLDFSVSLLQGDSVAIKYDSGGKDGEIEDLSITLIGTYD